MEYLYTHTESLSKCCTTTYKCIRHLVDVYTYVYPNLMRLFEPIKISNFLVKLSRCTNVYITVEPKCTRSTIMPKNQKRTVYCSEQHKQNKTFF